MLHDADRRAQIVVRGGDGVGPRFVPLLARARSDSQRFAMFSASPLSDAFSTSAPPAAVAVLGIDVGGDLLESTASAAPGIRARPAS